MGRAEAQVAAESKGDVGIGFPVQTDLLPALQMPFHPDSPRPSKGTPVRLPSPESRSRRCRPGIPVQCG